MGPLNKVPTVYMVPDTNSNPTRLLTGKYVPPYWTTVYINKPGSYAQHTIWEKIPDDDGKKSSMISYELIQPLHPARCCPPKVCQMLSWGTKNTLHLINIWDTVTNVLPFCSVFQAPSYEPDRTLIAWFLPKFAYLSMLFILDVVWTAGSADHIKYK